MNTTSPAADAARVRELLRKAGLSPRAAARALEIDELSMRGYCTGGHPVPRHVMLAIEHLVDLRRVKVYYITRAENTANILANGFRDGTGRPPGETEHRGVWVSDRLLVLLSGIELGDIACFEIRVPKEWVLRYEWREAGRGYREFLVPAIELNEFPRRRLADKEWLSLPWGH
jgi:hypothetical protein